MRDIKELLELNYNFSIQDPEFNYELCNLNKL